MNLCILGLADTLKPGNMLKDLNIYTCSILFLVVCRSMINKRFAINTEPPNRTYLGKLEIYLISTCTIYLRLLCMCLQYIMY